MPKNTKWENDLALKDLLLNNPQLSFEKAIDTLALDHIKHISKVGSDPLMRLNEKELDFHSVVLKVKDLKKFAYMSSNPELITKYKSLKDLFINGQFTKAHNVLLKFDQKRVLSMDNYLTSTFKEVSIKSEQWKPEHDTLVANVLLKLPSLSKKVIEEIISQRILFGEPIRKESSYTADVHLIIDIFTKELAVIHQFIKNNGGYGLSNRYNEIVSYNKQKNYKEAYNIILSLQMALKLETMDISHFDKNKQEILENILMTPEFKYIFESIIKMKAKEGIEMTSEHSMNILSQLLLVHKIPLQIVNMQKGIETFDSFRQHYKVFEKELDSYNELTMNVLGSTGYKFINDLKEQGNYIIASKLLDMITGKVEINMEGMLQYATRESIINYKQYYLNAGKILF